MLLCLEIRLKTFSRIADLSQHAADGRKFQQRKGVAVEIFPSAWSVCALPTSRGARALTGTSFIFGAAELDSSRRCPESCALSRSQVASAGMPAAPG
jgi:hypothetical protein